MAFKLSWADDAAKTFGELKAAAQAGFESRKQTKRTKASKQEGLFKQVTKCLDMLAANPRHPGLQTHPYSSIPNPYDKDEKVFEAYAQNRSPSAYRVFWCYGPKKAEITIIAITPHP